ncbi:unnamed protein product, partial [Didymodactylos carnosus]
MVKTQCSKKPQECNACETEEPIILETFNANVKSQLPPIMQYSIARQ